MKRMRQRIAGATQLTIGAGLGSLIAACTVDADPDQQTSAATEASAQTDGEGSSDPGTTSNAPTDNTEGGGTTASTSDGPIDPDDSGSDDETTIGGNEEGWMLVWSDEFDGDAIDPTHWEHENNCWGGGNGEQQCYNDDPAGSFVADGMLHIVARNETTSGPAVNDDDPAYDPNDTSATLPYASARLRTRDMGDWRYGRIEVRARLPYGQGTWPAIWMLPTARVYGGWAASGEIDIMEAVNLGVEGEDRVYGTLHYGSYWPNNVHSGISTTLPDGANPADDFHDYAVEWERGEIRWYLDDRHFATQRQDGWYTQYTNEAGELVIGEGAAPFDESFHLILNLAVGGAWAGNVNAGGIDASVFPQELTIDYVRVYRCSVDPKTGDGCDTIGDDFEVVPGHPPPG